MHGADMKYQGIVVLALVPDRNMLLLATDVGLCTVQYILMLVVSMSISPSNYAYTNTQVHVSPCLLTTPLRFPSLSLSLSLYLRRCTDPNVEDYGNKWSLSGMLRRLQSSGVNVAELMMRIEDVIIKTILCSEEQIAADCKLFMPYRGNCFG